MIVLIKTSLSAGKTILRIVIGMCLSTTVDLSEYEAYIKNRNIYRLNRVRDSHTKTQNKYEKNDVLTVRKVNAAHAYRNLITCENIFIPSAE